jgi:Family of unknown function (DUF6152)
MMRISPALVSLLCVAGVADAHHSRAYYDMTKEIVIEGMVTDLEWKNPHISMSVQTQGADGALRLQKIELTSVSMARAMGLSREAIAVGSIVSVRAHPGRGGPGTRAVGLDVRTSDGMLLPLNPDAGFAIAPPEVAEAQGLEGRWAPSVDDFNAAARAMGQWPYTDAARASMRAAQSTPGTVTGICKDFPPPGLSIFPELREIGVGDSAVEIRFEAQGQNIVRVVHLDQAAHPADVAPSLLGHSIGHFEQQTLVIDTVAFEPYSAGITIGVASSPRKHLVERLTPAQDRHHIRYEVTLEDPASLTGPASYTMQWAYRPDLEPSGIACDPEAARRILQ